MIALPLKPVEPPHALTPEQKLACAVSAQAIRDRALAWLRDSDACRFWCAVAGIPPSVIHARLHTLEARSTPTIRAALADVLAVLRDATAPLSSRRIEAACICRGRPYAWATIRIAIALGQQEGAIVTEPGPGRASWHRLADRCALRRTA